MSIATWAFESRFPLSLPCPGGGMVDARVSGARAARRAGSSPVLGTNKRGIDNNVSSSFFI